MSAPTFHPESGINEALLLRVLTQITQHPETHEQTVYAARGPDCGTAYCVAGWAVVLAGGEDIEFRWRPVFGPRPGGYIETAVRLDRGMEIDRAAADLLGVGWRDHQLLANGDYSAEALFDPDKSLDDLWCAAIELTKGRVSRAAMVVAS